MKQNKFVYFMYESCKVLIIKYIFIKSDSSTKTSIKPRIVPTHNAYFFKATEVGTKILTSFIFSLLQ